MTGSAKQPLDRILVRKYGGSSLASVQRIRTVAGDIRRARDEGYQIVVVVSAMGGTTDELNGLALQANPRPPRRELDMLLSVGERITMSLLAMALEAENCPAISFTGSQCGIITDGSHNDARILEVKGDRVRESLAAGHTVIVAGFQGVSRNREITTLGRGGSDTTAVALAAALKAVRCEILKDVDGVLSADPRRVPDAPRHEALTWEEMRQIAAAGCGVVHIRAVEYAAQHAVPLVVGSSFSEGPGTSVGPSAENPGATAAPTVRPSRYRPLALSVHEEVTRLRLEAADQETACSLQSLVLANLDPALTITEWLDSGEGFRWEVLAPAAALSRLYRALDEAETTFRTEENLTCFSLTGGRPDSWLEVRRHVAGILADLGISQWRLRADGSSLRILIPGSTPADLPRRLHRALLPS